MEFLNGLDIFVIIIICIFVLTGAHRGFIKTCFGFLPVIVSLIAANELYPGVSKFLRGTALYTNLSEKVAETLDLSGAVQNFVNQSESGIIESLKLPDFFKTSMLENNNPVVYQILGVQNLQDYISGYVANICINVISIIGVYIVVFIAVKIILSTLNLVAKLPGISFLNKTGGAAAGMAEGIVLMWILGIILVFFYSSPNFAPFFELLEQSKLALFLYNNNLLLFMILKIFA